MKYLLLVVVALVAFVAAEEKWSPDNYVGGTFEEINKKCVEEAGVTAEQKEKLSRKERPDEKEVHEYILCSLKKLEVYTDEGGIHSDRLQQAFTMMNLDADKVREILAKCVDSNEQKSTPAVYAYRVVNCMMNNKIDEMLKDAQDKGKNNDISKDE